MIEFTIKGEILHLLPEKAVYWPAQNSLFIADVHLGKVTHFRKAGIAIPKGAVYENLERLNRIIQKSNPRKVYLLGDLFHSELNTEWLYLKEFFKTHAQVEFILLQGNHDILHEWSYANSNLKLMPEAVELKPFILSHEPLKKSELYNLCGHIHPGVRLWGQAKQSMRFPCFYFSENFGILPAFGEFTGLHILKPSKKDHIFIVSAGEIISMN